MTEERETWTISFRLDRPGDRDPPVPIRIRHLLKFALRSLGLRNVGMKVSAPEEKVKT